MKKIFTLALLAIMGMGNAFAEEVIWSEDWSGWTDYVKAVLDGVNANYTFEGTVTNTDGSFKSGTAIYNEKLAGGEAPELLIAKNSGSFTAVIDLGGKSGDMTLSFKCNKAITVEVTGGTLGDNAGSGSDYVYPITGAEGRLVIAFKNTTSANARFDNAKLFQGESKKPAGITWGKSSTTLTIGEEITLALQNENNLSVTYTSSEETVATIAADGTITLIAAGETTLTASFEGNDEYEAAEASIKVTVKDASGTNPDEGQTGTETTSITVAQALEIINGLADKATTTEEYEIKGYVIKITEISTDYGNATFVIADSKDATDGLTVYRAKGIGGEKITDAEIVKVGDEVVVKGKLQKYVDKNNNMTPEVAQNGQIVSVNATSTGITTTKTATKQNGAIYNIAGQMVNKGYKGLVIQNGKKFFQK